ncbi:MAG TPA: hypothetical protein VHM26_05350, partial [Chitinophagaceae bacterium]|nr:hypothetical protein [Chitinophagaceae bacterium]
MRKVYKNDIYRIITEVVKFDPTKFILTDSTDSGHPVSTIAVRNSEMNFIFRNAKNSWEHFDVRFTRFSPNNEMSAWTPSSAGSYIDYQEAAKIFTQWLSSHAKNFIEEQDLTDNWINFQFETNIFELTQIRFDDNSHFNIDESSRISNSIDGLRQLIIEKFNPNNEQLEFINQRLDYLIESTNRLGKFDWTSTMISIMISIAINMGFDTQTGKDFFE